MAKARDLRKDLVYSDIEDGVYVIRMSLEAAIILSDTLGEWDRTGRFTIRTEAHAEVLSAIQGEFEECEPAPDFENEIADESLNAAIAQVNGRFGP